MDFLDTKLQPLKPCPFCGGEVTLLVDAKYGLYTFHHDGREKCPAAYSHHAGYGTEAEAIEAWNTRAERTCGVESKIFIEGEYVPCPYYEYEMECGGQFRWDEVEPPNYCPNCGAKVVDA